MKKALAYKINSPERCTLPSYHILVCGLYYSEVKSIKRIWVRERTVNWTKKPMSLKSRKKLI